MQAFVLVLLLQEIDELTAQLNEKSFELEVIDELDIMNNLELVFQIWIYGQHHELIF